MLSFLSEQQIKIYAMCYLLAASYYVLADAGSGYVQDGKTPGGAWTNTDIAIVRQKILRLLDPHTDARKEMFYDFNSKLDDEEYYGQVSENTLLRLSFHDCLKYTDGKGGCDGCLNWKGMGFHYMNLGSPDKSNWDKVKPMYYYPPVEHTDNNGMGRFSVF